MFKSEMLTYYIVWFNPHTKLILIFIYVMGLDTQQGNADRNFTNTDISSE